MASNWPETAEQRHARNIAKERSAWDRLGQLARQEDTFAGSAVLERGGSGPLVQPVGYQTRPRVGAGGRSADPRPVAVDIYVGGGGDGFSGIVRSFADQKRREHPERVVLYFGHGDDEQIAKAIDQYGQAGVPVNIVGHSWGATTAGDIAADRAAEVEYLATIDPVGVRRDMGGHRPEDLQRWDNVTAHEPKLSWNDFVALLGGKPSKLPTGEADSNSILTADHGDFAGMMRQSGIEARLYPPQVPAGRR